MSYSITQGDLEPDMTIELRVNGTVRELDDAGTYELRWKRPDCSVVTVALEVVNAEAGLLKRVWEAGDSDQPGTHEGQVVETIADRPRTYPTGTVPIMWTVTQRFA